jgi:hypothetical protein
MVKLKLNGAINNMDEIRDAKIVDTNLGIEDHGIFCININFEYDSCCRQGTGGYCIRGLMVEKAILGYLKFFEIEYWENLPGKKCRVKIIKGFIKEIQNIRTGEWLKLSDLFSEDEPMKAFRLLGEIDKKVD